MINDRNLVLGILAHVDAGKTTLSEAMLYLAGKLKKLGRVDHRDSFLDTHALERQRGITIFSKQAVLPLGEGSLTLLDTPGHVDFSAEAERTLRVLDCAVLVISGTDGVQAHTETLWKLLKRYHVPTFLFITKMDLPGPGREAILRELTLRLSDRCVDFGGTERDDAIAMCDEGAMEEYLENGAIGDDKLRSLIAARRLFPCFFGSGLKTEGVAEYGFTLKLDLKKIKKLSDRYHFILRTHYLISENLNLNEDEKRFVTDLSSYNDIAELYLISDVLITDYSSTFFDYANLRRPILFYVYDLEKYRDDLHGFYFDMEEECPGPLLRRTEEVVDALRNIDAVSVEYAGKYAEFREKYCSLDDGQAAKRVVSAAMRL